MKIEHNGQVMTGTLQDGYWTFLIQTDGADDVKLIPDADCTGQTEFTEIQLEYGEERTAFEAPVITTGDLTGLFKDVDNLLFEVTDPETGLKSRLFQLGGAWAIQNLNDRGDIISQMNLIEDMARIQARFIHLSGTSLIDDAVIKSSHIESLTADKITTGTLDAANVNVINLNVDKLTGSSATFISGGVKGLNSNMSLDGGGMTIQDSAGNTASISSTPDFKAIGADGTAVYMTKGNIDFASDGIQKFKIGTKLRDTQNGILINKGHGWALMRESDSFGGSPAQYHSVASRTLAVGASATIKKSAQYVWNEANQRLNMATSNVKGVTHTVETVGTGTFAGKYKLRHPQSAWGITGWVQASDIVQATDTWRQITTQYYNSSAPITTVLLLNGSTLPANTALADLPELTAGMNVLVKNAVAGNASGVGSVFEVWSEGNDNIVQFDYIIRHLYDLVKVSDRRLKHDIEESSVKALEHIDALSFKKYKWNRDGSEEDIGLIAQDSGIIRMEGETEGINTTKSVMLAMKGVQELHAIVKEQAEEIKQLKQARQENDNLRARITELEVNN